MKWRILTFGRHKGKSLPQVIFHDPDWFFWAYEGGVFRDKGAVEFEAKIIYERARSIKIPYSGGTDLEAEYFDCFDDRRPGWLRIVSRSQPKQFGIDPYTRKDVIDLSFPRSRQGYDKTRNKEFIWDVKKILFGDPDYRMTKERCEEFFSDEENFKIAPTTENKREGALF